MSSLKMLESDEQLDKMFTEVDVDGSGEIDFNEFLQMMASAMPGKDDDDARGDEMKAASIPSPAERQRTVRPTPPAGVHARSTTSTVMEVVGRSPPARR